MVKEKMAGVLIWLSHTRLNSNLLAQAARATIPPLLNILEQQMETFMTPPLAQGTSHQGGLIPDSPSCSISELSAMWAQVSDAERERKMASREGSVFGGGRSMANQQSISMDSSFSIGEFKPVRYTSSRSNTAPTLALMRAYRTTIAQQQSSTPASDVEVQGAIEEIEIIARAGQGAFGSVYVAMWKGLVTAVKVVRHHLDGRRAMRTAWELAISKTLQHPHIVTVYAVLTDVLVDKRSRRLIRFLPMTENLDGDGGQSSSEIDLGPRCQVIIMEYCSLGPLHQFVAERHFIKPVALNDRDDAHNRQSRRASTSTTVDLPLILSMLIEVASALLYLHNTGFVHCDLKPENILLKAAQGHTYGFVAKLSDFGLSDLFTSEGLLMGELGGTVTHIAPEIIGQQRVTKSCDVFSFGVIMFELYTCTRPYSDILTGPEYDKKTRDKAILARVTHENLRPTFPANAVPEYVALASRCWVTDPPARPSMAEVLAELNVLQDLYGGTKQPLDPARLASLLQPSLSNGLASLASSGSSSSLRNSFNAMRGRGLSGMAQLQQGLAGFGGQLGGLQRPPTTGRPVPYLPVSGRSTPNANHLGVQRPHTCPNPARSGSNMQPPRGPPASSKSHHQADSHQE